MFWGKCCWNLVDLQKSTFIWYALTVAWWREGSSVCICVCERIFWGVCMFLLYECVCVYVSSLCMFVCFFSMCAYVSSLWMCVCMFLLYECVCVCFFSMYVCVCFFFMNVCTCVCECGFRMWGSILSAFSWDKRY